MSKRIQVDSPEPVSIERNLRILVVDDNPSIHDDFRKILLADSNVSTELEQSETELFGHTEMVRRQRGYMLDFASSGEESIDKVGQALKEEREFAVCFMDVRMAPGIDGVEATVKLLEMTQDLQIVICTAYSDYSWSEMHERIGESDRVLILKKPFDNIEVLQCAAALTEKWRLQKESSQTIEGLTTFIRRRFEDDQPSSEERA